jgi:hypothetical protein
MSAITTFIGTMAETVLTMYLFGSLWDRWTLAFKITTPLLHILFMSAQLWGTWNFYKMYQKQCRLLAKKEGRMSDFEAAPKEEQDLSKNGITFETNRAVESRDGSEVELTERSLV